MIQIKYQEMKYLQFTKKSIYLMINSLKIKNKTSTKIYLLSTQIKNNFKFRTYLIEFRENYIVL